MSPDEPPPSPRPPERTPSRRELYREIAERNEREHHVDIRARRWFWVRATLLCLFWAAVGLVLGAFAFRVTDPELGRILMLTGQVVTWAGVLATLARTVIVAQHRGWL